MRNIKINKNDPKEPASGYCPMCEKDNLNIVMVRGSKGLYKGYSVFCEDCYCTPAYVINPMTAGGGNIIFEYNQKDRNNHKRLLKEHWNKRPLI